MSGGVVSETPGVKTQPLPVISKTSSTLQRNLTTHVPYDRLGIQRCKRAWATRESKRSRQDNPCSHAGTAELAAGPGQRTRRQSGHELGPSEYDALRTYCFG